MRTSRRTFDLDRAVLTCTMHSERLTYQPVEPAALDAFHALVQDEHVRRYLMDGNVFDRTWTVERIRESQALFATRGVGVWLTRETVSGQIVGFCGFLEIPSVCAEPQLVYALYERFTGRGYATEMARSAIAHARSHAGFREISAGVDEINAASLRVLEKLGFARISTRSGSFGNTLLMRQGEAQRSSTR
jgi:RimJ/RimL family protein N-acetyltransferase